MRELFRSEFLRMRALALLMAIVNLLALAFLARVTDPTQLTMSVHLQIGGVYLALGCALALLQIGAYRRAGMWQFLLHRPLSAWKSCASLVGASALALFVVVAVPMWLVTGWQSNMTTRVVDARHWLIPLSAWLVALCGYTAGGLWLLRRWRYAIAPLALLAWLVVARAAGSKMLLVELLVLCWLLALLVDAFRPDQQQPPRGGFAMLLTAVPLAGGAYGLMLLTLLGIELGWIVQGSHPLNTATPPPAGSSVLERMEPRARLQLALDASPDAVARTLKSRVGNMEARPLDLRTKKTTPRHALSSTAAMQFADRRRHLLWTLSHDDMRLHGVGIIDGRDAGLLGIESSRKPFSSMLQAVAPNGNDGDFLLMDENSLYRYKSADLAVKHEWSVPGGETIAGAKLLVGHALVFSNKAIYFTPVPNGDTAGAGTRRTLLPGGIGDLWDVDIYPIDDGVLVNLLFSEQAHTSRGASPRLSLIWLHADGRVDTLTDDMRKFDYPAIHRYRTWWPSPALHGLGQVAYNFLMPPEALEATVPTPRPRAITWLAVLLSLGSAVTAIVWIQRRGIRGKARLWWVVFTALLGLPGLGAMLLMTRRSA